MLLKYSDVVRVQVCFVKNIFFVCLNRQLNFAHKNRKNPDTIRAFLWLYLFCSLLMVEEGGFEPPKRNATDLQSAPFGHSGTPPYAIGAGRRIRTPDLLITNQLLYRLSYTSMSCGSFHSKG